MRKNSEAGSSDDEEKPEEPTPATVLDTKHRYFIGKDYSNSYEKDFEFLEKYSEGISPFLSLSSSLVLPLLVRLHRSKDCSSNALA